MKGYYGFITVLFIFSVGTLLGCTTPPIAIPTATFTPTAVSPTATTPPDTPKPIPPTATKPVSVTVTASPTALLVETPIMTATATLTPEPGAFPTSFTMELFATNETNCDYDDFNFLYGVEIDLAAGMMTMTQIINGLILTGPIDAETYTYDVSLGGLPGTEQYRGQYFWDGVTLTMTGTYSYFDDPNQGCEGLWETAAEVVP